MKYRYLLLLMGSMAMNALSMDKQDNEDGENAPNDLLVKHLLPYGSDIPSSPNFDPNLYTILLDALFDDKSPLNKVVMAASPKKESSYQKTDKKS